MELLAIMGGQTCRETHSNLQNFPIRQKLASQDAAFRKCDPEHHNSCCSPQEAAKEPTSGYNGESEKPFFLRLAQTRRDHLWKVPEMKHLNGGDNTKLS